MVQAYIRDYPRPQFVRADWTNLNGTWRFAFDREKRGEAAGWYRALPGEKTIRVPYTYETGQSGIDEQAKCGSVWYQRLLPAKKSALCRNRLLLHFEGCDYHTRVWVNGMLVGEHTGGYTRFSFDITDFLQENDNLLVVCARDGYDTAQPRGKQRWRDESFGCWYTHSTGIWKTVWMETVAPEHLLQAKITPCIKESCVDFEFETCAEHFGPELTLEVTMFCENQMVSSAILPVLQRHSKIRLPIYEQELHQWGVKLWSPQAPDLYDLTFILRRGGAVVDTVRSYFGLRDIRIENGNILLNGSSIYQRLVLDQGYWPDSGLSAPDEEAFVRDLEKIRAMGYNGLRMHQKVEDERFLYWCDVMGILVWAEMPSAYDFTDRAIKDFTAQWTETVQQIYNHPSVITWVPFNESWGIRQVKTDPAQQAFTLAIYNLTKSMDPMRPVVTNDGWEHTVSDIITLHDYEESGSALLARYTQYWNDMLHNRLYYGASKSAFAQGYRYRGQPVMISEFGGIAFAGEDGWGYGNAAADREAFLKRFDELTTSIKKLPNVVGYCYTQLTDVQQEVNGLMDMERNYKLEPEKIREINLRPVGERDSRMSP